MNLSMVKNNNKNKQQCSVFTHRIIKQHFWILYSSDYLPIFLISTHILFLRRFHPLNIAYLYNNIENLLKACLNMCHKVGHVN